MPPFFEHAARRFHRQAIARANEFSPPFDGKPYPCLVWNHAAAWTTTEASALAQRLLDSECRYVVSAGAGCELLHDVVDELFVHRFLDRPDTERDAHFVMTTWHTNEPVDDTTFFFAWNTSFDGHDFTDLLLLHVGGAPEQHSAIEASVRKEAVGDGAP